MKFRNPSFFISISLIVSTVLLYACVFRVLNQHQMIYKSTDRRELRINLPGGKGEENFKTNLKGAMEQFFAYQDSSIIYAARDIVWPTANEERVRQAEARTGLHSVYFAGIDEKGLHWKEVHIEGFKIGYVAVPSSRAELFDRALSSIRIK